MIERGVELAEEVVEFGGDERVGDPSQVPCPDLVEAGGRRVDRRGVDIAERDRRAGSSERFGDRSPDPAAATDDHRGLAAEIETIFHIAHDSLSSDTGADGESSAVGQPMRCPRGPVDSDGILSPDRTVPSTGDVMTESTYLGDTPVDLDAFETQCPQPLYAEMARQTPFRTDDGMVYLTRMADVTTALKQHEIRSGGEAMGSHRPLIPLNIDGPEHTKYRRLLDPLFAPKRVATFEPVVRALADELIDAFIDDGQVELFGAFCDPLPSRVFLGILGLPQSDVAFLQEFKEAAIRPRGTTPEAALAYQEEKTQGMYAYLNAELDRREALADPGDDVIGWFLQTEVDGDRLTRENILDIVYLLVIAGLDTVASSLSCLIAWLAQHPEERERVVNDPALLPRVIEELMRFESPVPMASRTAVADIDVNGKEVKAGDMLVVVWSAANLDPDVFDRSPRGRLRPGEDPACRVRERLSPVSRIAPRTPRAPHRDRPVPRAHSDVPFGRRHNSRVPQPGSAEREPARARFRPRAEQAPPTLTNEGNSMRLQDKVVVITGAGHGLGRESSPALCLRGCKGRRHRPHRGAPQIVGRRDHGSRG